MKDRLLSRNYVLMLSANFLLYMGFYLLLPVLPFFLSESFGADNGTVGTALSCYTIAALLIRPFSGYLLDAFARKPLYLLAYAVYMVIFSSYLLAGCMAIFVVLRMIHGFAFGMVTVGGNTIVIDVMPSSRRGEGLGYYGMSNNIAMSIGPMIGLFLHDHYSFSVIFVCACCSCLVGLLAGSMVKVKAREPVVREPISLDRFILLKGIPAGVTLLLLSVPYGITTTYIAMYGRELGVTVPTGVFFSFLAVGIAGSRVFSGKLVDRGYTTQVILFSIAMAAMVFVSLGMCRYVAGVSASMVTVVFMGSALMMGVSFGIMFPAYNTLFVNLAPNNMRGTAVSTYLTSWDVGIGLGLLIGGYVSEYVGFDVAYFIGAVLAVCSWIYFYVHVGPSYERDKVR